MRHRIGCNALQTVVALFFTLLARPGEAAEHYTFVSQWGGLGSAPGAFQYPFGLAVDNECNVYVADAGNNRIQKFSSVGAVLGYWGTAGSGTGQFDFPQGIAVDPLSAVYVTDTNNHRIQKFSTSGTFLGGWGQHGSANGYFDYPTGIAAEPYGFGSIYVAEPLVLSDSSNQRVQQFTFLGGFVSKWPGLVSPQDVAVDLAGNVFVLDDNRVVKYTHTGNILTQWGAEGAGSGQFDLPAGLCVDGLGNVYVADTGNHRIQMFTNTGAFVTMWGSFGTGPGQFRFPADVAVDDSGSVYVSDQVNHRIQKFSPRRVLLVHGICGDAESWDAFAQALVDSGFSVDRLQYGTAESSLRPAAYVNVLAAKVEAMGTGSIAVIAHSMGGLIAREYMRRQAAAGKPNRIAQLVTLGTPHHGSDELDWMLTAGYSFDAMCAARSPGQPPCIPFDLIVRVLPCLGSNYSRPALVDMLPGSWFLNRLNYGADSSSYDSGGARGWSTHQPETGLAPGVYYATIAGTGSICAPLLRSVVWHGGAEYHPNDGVVSVGSAMLSNTSVFRARDVDLPLAGDVAHASGWPHECHIAYYASTPLGQKMARVLSTAPTSPPVDAPMRGEPMAPLSTLAAAEDSLCIAPAIVDSVLAGQLVTRTVAVPPTTLLTVLLASTDAHLELVDPNGTTITGADTSSAVGLKFVAAPGGGLEGFTLANPLAGTWTLRVDATGSSAHQQYTCLLRYSSDVSAQLAPTVQRTFDGDSIRVLGSASDQGGLRADVSWACRVIGPNGSSDVIELRDDGAHGDNSANDGIFGAAFAPDGGAGSYRIVGSALVPGRGEFVAGSECEVAERHDLSVESSGITLSRNLPHPADSLTVYASVRNAASVPALGVPVEVRDLTTGRLLDRATVDVPAMGTVVVQAPWVVSAPDTHTIGVQISPFVLDEVDYANNGASRLIVVGEPLAVEPRPHAVPQVRFYPPQPNPTSGLVKFAFSLPRAGSVTLGVLDVLGRQVRNWNWTALAPGPHTIAWDGRGS
ncbi:MAG: alpha/beta fold hydrolase, partial [Candidatus Eisenbacteria bacterium]